MREAGSMVTNSLGRRNSTSSSITVNSSTSAGPSALEIVTTSSTNTSGAEAPAVIPTACAFLSHAGLMSRRGIDQVRRNSALLSQLTQTVGV